MNGRVYDYNLGRFLSVDPFIQAPGNSQSMNPYSYIMNNPLSGTDPSGYMSRCAGVLDINCTDPSEISVGISVKTERHNGSACKVGNCGGQAVYVTKITEYDGKGKESVTSITTNHDSIYSLGELNRFLSSTGGTKIIDALISNHVYNDGGFLPTFISKLSSRELSDLKLDTITFKYSDDSDFGFNSALYFDSNREQYVYAFAGTEDTLDMVTNIANGIGFKDPAYARAVRNTRKIRFAVEGELRLTGHSLGGGLAAVSAIVNRVHANTFNAAFVHDGVINGFGGNSLFAKDYVTAYFVKGEFLSTFKHPNGKLVKLRPHKPWGLSDIKTLGVPKSFELHSIRSVLLSKDISQ